MANGLNRRWWTAGLVAVVFCFLMAGDVVAKDRKGRAAKDLGQLAIVEVVDVTSRTLVMGGTTYFVPKNADLEDASGQRVSLSDIHGLGSAKPADTVEMWTRRSGRDGRPEILRLQIRPAMSF